MKHVHNSEEWDSQYHHASVFPGSQIEEHKHHNATVLKVLVRIRMRIEMLKRRLDRCILPTRRLHDENAIVTQ
jgi:hypothetical protein